jgi:uncharacterized cupredoxin-like copper-binding protein
MFTKTIATLLLGVSILGLSACGAQPSKNAISVSTTDFKFAPTTWKVAKGQPVSFTITNKGQLQHEWVLIKQGQSVTMPFDDDDEDKVFWEIEANPGESKTETFTAPAEAGSYTIVCGTPAHLEQGMAGTLVVE